MAAVAQRDQSAKARAWKEFWLNITMYFALKSLFAVSAVGLAGPGDAGSTGNNAAPHVTTLPFPSALLLCSFSNPCAHAVACYEVHLQQQGGGLLLLLLAILEIECAVASGGFQPGLGLLGQTLGHLLAKCSRSKILKSQSLLNGKQVPNQGNQGPRPLRSLALSLPFAWL